MTHDIVRMERLREFAHVAHCECGYRAEGPNLLTAQARHEQHQHIQEARAALEKAKEAAEQ